MDFKPVKPNHIKADANNPNRFVVEPLERGFGHTIANSLRRILLSSIEGAAVTWLNIAGKNHEFDTIDGVKEDILDLILNLKALRIKFVEGYDEATLSLNLHCDEDRMIVKAGDFVIEPAEAATIINPEQQIATMNKNATLVMECGVNLGRGYVPAAELRERLSFDRKALGYIYLDAAFSPVVHVSYNVESTRHEQYTDYDKLLLDVTTNGTVAAEDAIHQAACILADHLVVFKKRGVNAEDTTFGPSADSLDNSAAMDEQGKYLNTSIEELELSVRSHNCLEAAGIKTIAELIQKSESEMLKFRNFGRKSLNEIKAMLKAMGLEFDMEIGPNGKPMSKRK